MSRGPDADREIVDAPHTRERQAVFSSADLEREAGRYALGRSNREEIAKAVAKSLSRSELQPRIFRDPRGLEGVGFTTSANIAFEQRLLQAELQGRGAAEPLARPIEAARVISEAMIRSQDQGYAWTDDQRAATRALLTSSNRVVGVQGYAGTAKTTTVLATFARAAQAAGYRVTALAPSASAARTIGEALNLEGQTVARHLKATKSAASPKTRRGEIWLVDEASLLSARDMARLLDAAARVDARTVLVGDVKQLGSVEAGAAFRQLQDANMETVRLAQIVRQTNASLSRELRNEYGLRYFILDEAQLQPEAAQHAFAAKEMIADKERSGHTVINSLIKVDFLSAQRHLSDGHAQARTEDLSKRLSRFYTRNQRKRNEDHNALMALAMSEEQLTKHFAGVFGDTFKALQKLGYPGLANPTLEIRAALKLERLMGDQQAKVHYLLEEATAEFEALVLPDSYNGLGFKNLIYMGVELLDIHSAWATTEEGEEDMRQPIHLVFIEEPEAHMHAQLQQAFVRKLTDLIPPKGEDGFTSQFVITTHSPHILYERGFRPIRYFRRSAETGAKQSSAVFNLSTFYAQNEQDRDFLERYMKLTHCDLFFADGAILVEGNVERLVLPLMIANGAKSLGASYLSILEVGGAFAFRFRKLIEFLGLPTLIITDLDSVHPTPPRPEHLPSGGAPGAIAEPTEAEVPEHEEDLEEDGANAGESGQVAPKPGTKCPAGTPGAVTANQTLRQWLPGKTLIEDLLAVEEADRLQAPTADGGAHVMATYQMPVTVKWGETTLELKSRTLEEAFAYENLAWCQKQENRDVGLHWAKSSDMTLEDLTAKIHKRIKGEGFKKTNFALGLLACTNGGWVVPTYIQTGLDWLALHVATGDETPDGEPADAGGAGEVVELAE